jgi:hypothetical protein
MPNINAPLVTWNPNFGGPDAFAKPGTLGFTLVPVTNFIYFIPVACSVKDGGGVNVPLTVATPSEIAFAVAAGETYTLTVAYLAAPPNHPASAAFQEDCAKPNGSITVSQITAGADYTIQVA